MGVGEGVGVGEGESAYLLAWGIYGAAFGHVVDLCRHLQALVGGHKECALGGFVCPAYMRMIMRACV